MSENQKMGRKLDNNKGHPMNRLLSFSEEDIWLNLI